MLAAPRSWGTAQGKTTGPLPTTFLLAGPTRLLAHRVLVEGARLPHRPQLHGHLDLCITREDERARQPGEAWLGLGLGLVLAGYVLVGLVPVG